jgi:exopolysaccharide production protein ExoQ
MLKSFSNRTQNMATVWVFMLLFAGQGFRNLIGLGAYSVLCIITVTMISLMFWRNWEKKKTPTTLILFTALAGLTVIWSAYKPETLLATAILVLTSLTAVLIASSYTWKDILKLFNISLLITVAGSLLFEAVITFLIQQPVLPLFMEFVDRTTVDHTSTALLWSENNLLEGGPVQGFMGNRNLLGFTALLLIITSTYAAKDNIIRKRTAVLGILLGLTAHFLTASATINLALVAVVFILVGSFFIRRSHKHKHITGWVVVGTTTLLGITALKNYDHLFRLFDRKPNLTNRTVIWDKVISLALERPEGWGWVSYWPVWKVPFNNLLTIGGMPVSHAHNAYLDVWLQLGVLGVILLFSIFTIILLNTWRIIEHATPQTSNMAATIFTLTSVLAIQGFTESRLLLEGNWLLFILMLMYTPVTFKKKKVKEADNITHERQRTHPGNLTYFHGR